MILVLLEGTFCALFNGTLDKVIACSQQKLQAEQYTVGVNKTVTFPFRSVPFRRKRNGRSPCPTMETGRAEATQRKMQSTIPIVASTKMTPQKPKKAKRSIALSKRSHLEAIRVDWQREIDPSSIADFEPSRASIAELTQNRRAAVVNCLRTV